MRTQNKSRRQFLQEAVQGGGAVGLALPFSGPDTLASGCGEVPFRTLRRTVEKVPLLRLGARRLQSMV